MSYPLPSNETLAGLTAPAILPAAARAGEAFARLYTIIARLRAPDGCPWDREQDAFSIRGNIIEEAYELVESIDEKDVAHICEESGDLYLLATMVAYMYEQEKAFSVAAALDSVCEKLIRRHPHVFEKTAVADADAVLAQWNDIKTKLEGRPAKDSRMDEVSRALPPLERAYKLQKKAAKAGFDWASVEPVWAKLNEEIAETRAACAAADPANSDSCAHVEDEIGDILFTVVNLARKVDVDPSLAMRRAAEKFARRFRYVEQGMKSEGKAMNAANMAAMDRLWNASKKQQG